MVILKVYSGFAVLAADRPDLFSAPQDREERRRLRTVAFLSNSIPGAVREPDTESDEEKDGKALRIPTKTKKSGTSTPTIAGMK